MAASPTEKQREEHAWPTRLLFGMSSLVIALLLAELLLRTIVGHPYAMEGTDAILYLRLHHRNADRRYSREGIDNDRAFVRFRTDKRRYIQPSRHADDPVATVAFLGGSTTECSAVEESLRFPALTGRILAENHGLSTITLNAARSGSTLHDSLVVLFTHVLQDAPDVVVVMHATNDAGVLQRDPSYRSRGPRELLMQDVARWAMMRFSHVSALAGLVRRVVTIRSPEPQGRDEVAARLASLHSSQVPLAPFVARLHAFVSISRAFGIEPVLMTQPLAYARSTLTPDWADTSVQARFNSAIRQVATDTGANLIDLVALLDASRPGWRESGDLFYDGMHVHDNGSQVYAALIAPRLASILQARNKSSLEPEG